MNPKEKAKELFTKFSGNTVHFYSAKQCALISVIEIINNLNYLENIKNMNDLNFEYWQEVYQEIEKL